MASSDNDLTKKLRDTESALKTSERQLSDAGRSRKKMGWWGLLAGVVLAVAGGQFFPGYQLDATAARASEAAAYKATNDVLAHLCAERFLNDADLAELFPALEQERSEYEQHTFLRKGPWGLVLTGSQVPNSVASECLSLIQKRMDKTSKAS